MASHEPLAPATTASLSDMTPPPCAALQRRRSQSTPILCRHGTYALQRDWVPSKPIASRRVKWRSYVNDLFHTTVHQPWWRMLLLVFFLYAVCWTFYASIGFFLFPTQCLGDTTDPKGGSFFLDWLNWTIQTMSTIGYGQLMPTCWATHAMLPVMVVNGFVLDACTFGFVFAKFASPANRSSTLLISEKLVGNVTRTLDGGLELTLSLRLVNTRKHPVSQPRIDIFLVDHRALELSPPEPPEFHELPVTVKPPLTFLEYPCTATCAVAWRASPSAAAAAAAAPAPPLQELLRGFAESGASAGSWPLSSQVATLEALSLVAVFSAQEPAVGACFEVRRTFPLLGVEWGCKFDSMLSAKAPRPNMAGGSQTILDISRLNAVTPVGAEPYVVVGASGF